MMQSVDNSVVYVKTIHINDTGSGTFCNTPTFQIDCYLLQMYAADFD